MTLTPQHRFLWLLLFLGVVWPLFADTTIPSLNSPATKETHPGKFVWAELFTEDAPAAAKFYSGVLGWSATPVEQKGISYMVLRNGTRPVAGIRQRGTTARKHAARWISYAAVADITTSLRLVTNLGGNVRAPARKFPDIGAQAILTDKAGYPVGLLQSSSGDAPDVAPNFGDWEWFHLMAADPQGAADFYTQLFGYGVTPNGTLDTKTELLLTSGEFNRGGISLLSDQDGAEPGWIGIVRVENIEKTLARVPTFKGEVLVPAHATANSRFAVIADPTGGTIGVVEYLKEVSNTKEAQP